MPTESCTPLRDADSASLSLNEKIALADLADVETITIADKWILSSALQKSIRRGMAAQSRAISIRLHAVDPTYLRKRLPIIALEDIGMGDIGACQGVLEACESTKLWRQDADRTISFLVSSMAGAVKSRAACDAFCLTEVHPARVSILSKLLMLHADELIDLASDGERPGLDRLYALRVLGGIKDDGYRTLSRCNLGALDTVAANLGLPAAVRWLLARQAKTAGLAAMLPGVWHLAQDAFECKVSEFPRAMEVVRGLPLCALDQYTRLGKSALRQFYLSSAPLKAFTETRLRGHSPQPLVNLAMFQAESSLLDRHLSSPPLDALHEQTEDFELCALGLKVGLRKELHQLLRDNADTLAYLREEHLER